MALKAVRFVLSGSEDIVARLLDLLPSKLKENEEYQYELDDVILQLPVTVSHEASLNTIIDIGNLTGGAAAALVCLMKGDQAVIHACELLLQYHKDYNFCSTLSRGIASIISLKHRTTLFDFIGKFDCEVSCELPVDDGDGFVEGISQMLGELDLDAVLPELMASHALKSPVRRAILFDTLRDHESSKALAAACELLVKGCPEAAFAFSFIARDLAKDENADWSCFKSEHLRHCIKLLDDKDNGRWALDCLSAICRINIDLAKELNSFAEKETLVPRASLLWAAGGDSRREVFASLRQLLSLSSEELSKQPFELLKSVEMSWHGYERLMVSLLRLHHLPLAAALLETAKIALEGEFGRKGMIGMLDLGPSDWWLDWMQEVMRKEDDWSFLRGLSYIFDRHVAEEVRQGLIFEFNNPNSPFRPILANHILLVRSDLSTDDFSADSIEFLITHLEESMETVVFYSTLLGKTATEKLVVDVLVPRFHQANGQSKRNLAAVIREAGGRHRKRYISE